MMPGEDVSLAARLGQAGRNSHAVPILMLTARSEAEDRVRGLEIGRRCYLGSPASRASLTLRIASILRRAPPRAIAGLRLLCGLAISVSILAVAELRQRDEIVS